MSTNYVERTKMLSNTLTPSNLAFLWATYKKNQNDFWIIAF